MTFRLASPAVRVVAALFFSVSAVAIAVAPVVSAASSPSFSLVWKHLQPTADYLTLVNDHGYLAGTSLSDSGQSNLVLAVPSGGKAVLHTLPQPRKFKGGMTVYGLNASNQLAANGCVDKYCASQVPYLGRWAAGKVSWAALPLPAGSTRGIAEAVNVSGIVGGDAGTTGGNQIPGLWSPAGLHGAYQFTALPATSTPMKSAVVWTIDDQGDVVGIEETGRVSTGLLWVRGPHGYGRPSLLGSLSTGSNDVQPLGLARFGGQVIVPGDCAIRATGARFDACYWEVAASAASTKTIQAVKLRLPGTPFKHLYDGGPSGIIDSSGWIAGTVATTSSRPDVPYIWQPAAAGGYGPAQVPTFAGHHGSWKLADLNGVSPSGDAAAVLVLQDSSGTTVGQDIAVLKAS